MSSPMELAVSLYSVSGRKTHGPLYGETGSAISTPLLPHASRWSLGPDQGPTGTRSRRDLGITTSPMDYGPTSQKFRRFRFLPPTGHGIPNLRSDEAPRKSQPSTPPHQPPAYGPSRSVMTLGSKNPHPPRHFGTKKQKNIFSYFILLHVKSMIAALLRLNSR